jgi:hypothetical protein
MQALELELSQVLVVKKENFAIKKNVPRTYKDTYYTHIRWHIRNKGHYYTYKVGVYIRYKGYLLHTYEVQ